MNLTLHLSIDVAQHIVDLSNVAVRTSQDDARRDQAPAVACRPSKKLVGPLPDLPRKGLERSDLGLFVVPVEGKSFLRAAGYDNARSVETLNLSKWRRMINLGRGNDSPPLDDEQTNFVAGPSESHVVFIPSGKRK
jgi:hypothetical protein